MDDEPVCDSFESLFPMPMTSIEKFHWFDGRSTYPNIVFCRIRVSGKLDKALAKQAWQIAIQRQPFGDVRPEQRSRKWFWCQGPRGAGELELDGWDGTRFEFKEYTRPTRWRFKEHPTDSPTGIYLGIFSWPQKGNSARDSTEALDSEPASSEFTTEVWFYIHHALGDGVGSILTINDWLIVYGNLKQGRSPNHGLNRLDASLLRRRNSLGLTTKRYLKHLYKQPIALFGATKFVFRKTAELFPKRSSSVSHAKIETHSEAQSSAQLSTQPRDANTAEDFPCIVGCWLDSTAVDGLAEHAKSHSVMPNSVLVGQLYLALAEFRSSQNEHSSKDWMRIIVPMSIRNVSDRRLPIANRATLVQIDRRICDSDFDLDGVGKDEVNKKVRQLYSGIDREIGVIRSWHLDKMFLLVIRMLSVSNRLLKWTARNDKSRGMAVFTNLGEPLRKSLRKSRADIEPCEVDLAGPIRLGTPLNVSVARFGNRMRVSLHFDPRVLTSEEAQAFLKLYSDRIASLS